MDQPGVSPIDAYLAAIAKPVQAELRMPARILAEIRDHLADATDRHAEAGLDRREAERRAVEEFGDTSEIVEAFKESQEGGSAVPSTVTRVGGLAGMVGVFLAGAGIGGGGLATKDRIAFDPGWSQIAFAGALLMLAGLIAVVARGWGRLGTAGRFAAAAIPLAIPMMAFGGWSPVAPIGIGLVAASMVACVARLVRLRVLALLPLVLFASGLVVWGGYAIVGVEGEGIQAVPFVLTGAGWLWLCYTLWSERPVSG